MKRFIVLLAALAFSLTAAAADPVFDNPLVRQRADPQVLLHTDGNYYFTATVPEYDRIEVRRTRDLNALDHAETKVVWRKHATGPMSYHIWAPEIHHIDGKWYIYFTAGRADAHWEIRPYVLENANADPLQGQWKELGQVRTGWESFSLDATTFEHKGKRYYVWVQTGRTPEEGKGTNIYIAQMNSPSTITGKVTMLTKPEYPWEMVKYAVNEGPAVLVRHGKVFLTYSASVTDANYAMGMLTADANADLLDPASWKKSPTPVFKSANGQWGPGHNGFTTTPDGKTDILIYHARDYRDIVGDSLNDANRHTRAQAIHWKADGTPDLGEPMPDLGKIAPKPLYRDPVFDGAADPVVVDAGSDRWLMFYTNRRANANIQGGVAWVHGTPIGIAESRDGGASWTYIGDADITLPPELGGKDATRWAPDVVRDDAGLYHMFLTVVPGIFTDWQHPRYIVHLTSKDLLHWRDPVVVPLPTQRAIDPSLIRLPDGGWRMVYNNESDHKSVWYTESPDLMHWTDRGKLISDQRREGPKAFRWRGQWWLITDVWDGLAVYRSDDNQHWARQPSKLLQTPGKGEDDQVIGGHPDVVVSGERAWLFYFTHPGRKPGVTADDTGTRRSSIQVVELQPDGVWLKADRDAPTRIALHRE